MILAKATRNWADQDKVDRYRAVAAHAPAEVLLLLQQVLVVQ